MPRIALVNILIGFAVIFIAACAGSFVAFDTTATFLQSGEAAQLHSWQMLLQRSAHGHFNLFGFLHIAFGLTLSYSNLPFKIKKWQTIGLLLGTLAMGPGLYVRSHETPGVDVSASEYVIGVCLSAALASIAVHVFGLAYKVLRR